MILILSEVYDTYLYKRYFKQKLGSYCAYYGLWFWTLVFLLTCIQYIVNIFPCCYKYMDFFVLLL